MKMTLFKSWETRLIVDLLKTQPLCVFLVGSLLGLSGQPRPDRICRSFENGYALSKGDKELKKAITTLLELKP